MMGFNGQLPTGQIFIGVMFDRPAWTALAQGGSLKVDGLPMPDKSRFDATFYIEGFTMPGPEAELTRRYFGVPPLALFLIQRNMTARVGDHYGIPIVFFFRETQEEGLQLINNGLVQGEPKLRKPNPVVAHGPLPGPSLN